MSKVSSFQETITRLQEFWAKQNCVIWQPYNIQVGAGTMNPATFLRVLGPEPWNVGYVEPSIRPDDGRYGDNPNRMQMFYQYQVILKPDPGNSQEIYLQSLEALGIDRRKHDIRFVEDNWESPALGAWGLGWEVWLDGQEITQFTYFQQAGGQQLTPVSVEITYGLERIIMVLQGVDSVWDIQWMDNLSYGDILLQSEVEHCRYYFEVADIEALKATYITYEKEADRALECSPPLITPAHDYVLKCSHLFNVMDARGAIGVVERADYFRRMQRTAAKVALAYLEQRQHLEYPWLPEDWSIDTETGVLTMPQRPVTVVEVGDHPDYPAPLLLEIGTEELPSADLTSAIEQLQVAVPDALNAARLDFEQVTVGGTPRRLVVIVDGLSPHQRAEESIRRGPPVKAAFDQENRPTRAAEGFARSLGLAPKDLEQVEIDGGLYVAAAVKDPGQPAAEVLPEVLIGLIAGLKFEKTMRWNSTTLAFSRPIRWLVALYDKGVIPFSYAGLNSNRITRGTRPLGSPEYTLVDVSHYTELMESLGIIIDPDLRRDIIKKQADELAAKVDGYILEDPALLEEVANLVEQPTALLGTFPKEQLALPDEILIMVMKKHQRYFAVVDKKNNLLPCFVAVRNGDEQHLDVVTRGNEQVIQARFADARFFYQEDIKQSLESYLSDLKMLTFQEDIGSYYEKASRLEALTARLGVLLGLEDLNGELDMAIRAARLAKADLATRVVVEMTSLQGVMGRHYALNSGEPTSVADAIAEHYLPRFSGDRLPQSPAGLAVALADRLDSLVGLFSVGMQPTGSTDPYGLRRAALGLVQVLIGHAIDLDLQDAIDWAAYGYTRELGEASVTAAAKDAVLEFIIGRLRGLLRETFRHDMVEAVIAGQGANPYRAYLAAGQLEKWIKRENWQQVLDAYARCARITRGQTAVYTLLPDAFEEAVEKDLYAAYHTARKRLEVAPDLNSLLEEMERLVPAIDAFFAPADEGGVLVMHEDKATRENRLALLQHIVSLAEGIADFSHMEGF